MPTRPKRLLQLQRCHAHLNLAETVNNGCCDTAKPLSLTEQKPKKRSARTEPILPKTPLWLRFGHCTSKNENEIAMMKAFFTRRYPCVQELYGDSERLEFDLVGLLKPRQTPDCVYQRHQRTWC